MPSKPTKGTRQTNLELPVEVIDAAKDFARGRGETLSEVVVVALRRHMANPPPLPELVPLPPLPAAGSSPVAEPRDGAAEPVAKVLKKGGKK